MIDTQDESRQNENDYHNMLMAMANQIMGQNYEEKQLEEAIKLSMNNNNS